MTLFDGENGLALTRARVLDDARESVRKRRRISDLYGVPLAIKDNIFLSGFPTTDATYYFREFVPAFNADIVDDSLALGCVPIGKTNLHEIALGGTSAASYFGPVRNPLDAERVSGGSSGGSAVAVAKAKGPMLGLGTDTGGSIRVPAALCGIMGFKPTLGSLSLGGVFPLSATLDHVGLLTRTMPDMIRAFGHLGRAERPEPAKRHGRRKIGIGVPSKHFFAGAEEKVSKNFWNAMDSLEASGEFRVVEVPTDSSYERFTTARAAIQLSEASWFFREFVKSKSISRHVNPDVLTLLRRGSHVGQVRYYEANLIRLESIRAFSRLLKGLDLLGMPTTRIVAPQLSEVVGKEAGNLRRMLLQNTEVFNLNGFPALSIPTNHGANDLPTSMQFASKLGEDWSVLEAGELAMRIISRSAEPC